MKNTLQDLTSLSVAERIQLVADLWDSIARTPAKVPVPMWQKKELDRRKARFLKNPGSGMTWEQFKRSVNGRK
ncbi:MAG: addiction module protein [Candidatus Lindowbacteria bacterium RIFCSPLOWO2_12_FULL_62_27]|nr:MAG: addiction module protein [Candidatus Lindowbacteria bacterium RIFCSPLOWO2_12_FULL_62_27]OGH63996.1 MAG: addiction module protein [Candidatus Lindowbacteria bacterium RIFCSPLOWO2_02_FULL_62_12]